MRRLARRGPEARPACRRFTAHADTDGHARYAIRNTRRMMTPGGRGLLHIHQPTSTAHAHAHTHTRTHARRACRLPMFHGCSARPIPSVSVSVSVVFGAAERAGVDAVDVPGRHTHTHTARARRRAHTFLCPTDEQAACGLSTHRNCAAGDANQTTPTSDERPTERPAAGGRTHLW